MTCILSSPCSLSLAKRLFIFLLFFTGGVMWYLFSSTSFAINLISSNNETVYSLGMKRVYDELDIDDKRKSLRLTERFNLMEESHGPNWKLSLNSSSLKENCTIEFANLNRLQQDHPCVIQLIRRHFLHPPAPKDVPLNLKFPNFTNPSAGQSQTILRYLRNQVINLMQ